MKKMKLREKIERYLAFHGGEKFIPVHADDYTLKNYEAIVEEFEVEIYPMGHRPKEAGAK
jgi:hypothetical protein